jgi:hypothetical protein
MGRIAAAIKMIGVTLRNANSDLSGLVPDVAGEDYPSAKTKKWPFFKVIKYSLVLDECCPGAQSQYASRCRVGARSCT